MGLLRQSVFGRLAGYEDVNDAQRLARDPVMCQIIGGRAVGGRAASSSQMGRFETEVLATAANRNALADMPGQWIDAMHERQGLNDITLDMDSSVSPTHGDQEGAAWNGYFGCNCYHPLFIFNQFGHLERCALRNGNVHSADGWKALLAPVIARYAQRDVTRLFRADAAFSIPALYETLETAGYFYAIRLKRNAVLEDKISHRLTRPVRWPAKTKVGLKRAWRRPALPWCARNAAHRGGPVQSRTARSPILRLFQHVPGAFLLPIVVAAGSPHRRAIGRRLAMVAERASKTRPTCLSPIPSPPSTTVCSDD